MSVWQQICPVRWDGRKGEAQKWVTMALSWLQDKPDSLLSPLPNEQTHGSDTQAARDSINSLVSWQGPIPN